MSATLRTSNVGVARGVLEDIERVVGQIRARWPKVEVVLRGDSHFSNDEIIGWCKENCVKFVLSLAKDSRLKGIIEDEMAQARVEQGKTGKPARVFADFAYKTLESWSEERRVVAKAEHLPKGDNPRFVVTSVSKEEADAADPYERIYCMRCEMENRIKEC